MSYPIVYDRAGTQPSGGPTQGAHNLLQWCLGEFIGSRSGGIYNPRMIGTTNTPSTHLEGRGVDVMFSIENSEGTRLAEALRRCHADLGVQQIIWNREFWRNTSAAKGWRPYGGDNPHRDHVHFELTKQASRGLTPAAILAAVGPSEEEPMSLSVRVAAGRSLICDAYEQARGVGFSDPGGLRFWYAEVDVAAREDAQRQDPMDTQVLGVLLRCEAKLKETG